jgi:hypothetical protein
VSSDKIVIEAPTASSRLTRGLSVASINYMHTLLIQVCNARVVESPSDTTHSPISVRVEVRLGSHVFLSGLVSQVQIQLRVDASSDREISCRYVAEHALGEACAEAAGLGRTYSSPASPLAGN